MSFLIVDYSIRCDGARYEFMWYYSIAAIVVYPVGVSSNEKRNYDIELFTLSVSVPTGQSSLFDRADSISAWPQGGAHF